MDLVLKVHLRGFVGVRVLYQCFVCNAFFLLKRTYKIEAGVCVFVFKCVLECVCVVCVSVVHCV